MIKCCKGCQDRKENCHSTCEKYLKEREEDCEEKEKLWEKRRSQQIVQGYVNDKNRKWRERNLWRKDR